jgi:uncharacterized membrane protein YdjX (TVP38/TMEM64 family)
MTRTSVVARIGRWSTFVVALLALIIVPFALLGATLERWVADHLWNAGAPLFAAVLGAGLLAADVFLPIPSSLVATGLGALLGAPLGTMVGTVGLTAGCVLGYATGALARTAFLEELISGRDLQRVSYWLAKYGVTALILCRAVPVLAEASVIVAGAMRMRPIPTFAATTLANLGISVVYAGLGSLSTDAISFLLAFAASIILPGVILAAVSVMRRVQASRALLPR